MKSIYFEKNIPKILFTKFASKFCKPLLYSRLNAVKFNKNLPDPQLPAPDWVRIKNIACGVCGTDLNFFKSNTGSSIAFEPMPGTKKTFLGHETLGIIEKTGYDVTKFKIGDRVMIREYMSGCGNHCIKPKCELCKEGNYSMCKNYGESSPLDLPDCGGGFGDYFIAPEQQIAKIHDDLTDEQALMIEPAAVSLHSVLRCPPERGEKVMVLGAGTIGLGVIQWLKILVPDCIVYVMEKIKQKQDFALKLGADEIITGDPYKFIANETNGKLYKGMFDNKMLMGGFDKIYDCVGNSWSTHNSLRWLKARGKYIKIGSKMHPITFDETPLWWQELSIIGVNSHGMEHYKGKDIYTIDLVQEFMRKGLYKTEGFITHKFHLDEYKKAFKVMVDGPPDHVKAILICNE